MGLLANDCRVLGGAIDCDASDKAGRFISLCDKLGLPLLSLCDTPGFMVGPDSEVQGAALRMATLFKAGAKLQVPLVAIILRKAYGLGAMAMTAGSFKIPVHTAAWPTGETGPMGLEGAVTLGFKKELEAIEDASEREALFNQLVEQMYERGKATESAAATEIDAVIDPADTRRLVLRALA
jgi:acetyl-CoA carboxylase carboxyltransferase component